MARRHSTIPLLFLMLVVTGVGAGSILACRAGDKPAGTATASEASAPPTPSRVEQATPDAAPTAAPEPAAESAPQAPQTATGPTAAPTKRPTPDDCAKLQKKLLTKVTVERDAIVRRHSSCKTNDDCTVAYGGGCFTACGGTAFNKRGEDEMNASSNAIADACKPLYQAGCGSGAPVPTCSALNTRCAGGRCVVAPSR